jgi:hypothetical protein
MSAQRSEFTPKEFRSHQLMLNTSNQADYQQSEEAGMATRSYHGDAQAPATSADTNGELLKFRHTYLCAAQEELRARNP